MTRGSLLDQGWVIDRELELALILQRYLDETEIHLKNGWVALAAQYEGDLNESALTRALELLGLRHPVLRGCVCKNDRGDLLYVQPHSRPDLTVLEGDELTLRQEVRRPWNPAEAVARFLLIRSGKSGYLALRGSHAVVDGHKAMAVFAELWRLYTGIVNGSDVTQTPATSLPTSPYSLLRRGWVNGAVGPSASAPDIPRAPVACDYYWRRIQLGEEATARTLLKARRNNLSVHALLCGVILVTLRNHGKPSEPTPMRCLSAVDLQDYMDLPKEVSQVANALGMHRGVVTVPKNGNPVAVGREIRQQLEVAVVRRELSLATEWSSLYSSRIVTPLEEHLATATISNVGVVEPLVTPGDLTITDLLRPPTSQRMSRPFSGYGVETYGGRLNIRATYPYGYFSEADVEEIVAEITAQIS